MSDRERRIRTLTASEVETLIDWAAAEGWNPGLDDAAVFYEADRQGFLGAFADSEMVAGISAVAYGSDFGFIGLYICRPDKRGEGHGKAVWDAGFTRLAGRRVGLDGVPAQQANYARMGFVHAYGSVRLSGRFSGSPPANPASRLLTAELKPAVMAFDRRFFPGERSAFLDAWLDPPRMALALVVDGAVRGYGVVRPCRRGAKIGPLFVDDASDALPLFAALVEAGGGEVAIDVPDMRTEFIAALQAGGLAPSFETARMYINPPAAPLASGVFGITTLELG